MKKICSIAFVLVLTVAVLAGCRSNTPASTSASTEPTRVTTAPTSAPTTMPTTAPTTQATQPSTDMIGPSMGDMIPGPDDTIDPTNGANQDATGTRMIH